MRVTVLGEDAISSQATTYAEYRVFAALAQFAEAEKVRWARVGSDSLRIRTTGEHAYAAINRAIARISTYMAVRTVDRTSS
jgi:hypothetical protein